MWGINIKRKVIQIAESTQLISLPRKWAIEHGIKKGDELDIEESDNQIIITPLSYNKNEEKKLEITINSKDRFLRRMLFSPYIQGYTEIKVNYNDPKIFNLISDEVRFLMGYEIITQGANYCIIKTIATALDNDLDNIIKRIFWSTISIIKDIIDALSSKDVRKLESVESLEGTNNKLSYFSLRLLNNGGYKKDKNKTNSIYYTILCIEEIVDDLRDLCEYILKTKPRVNKDTITLFKGCMQTFKSVTSLFYNFNSEALYEFDKEIKALTQCIVKYMEKKGNDIIILSFLYKITTKISHISKEIHY